YFVAVAPEAELSADAVNAKGAGEPAEIQDLVEIVERAAEPDLELDVELRRTLVVRAGCSIRLFVPIKGRPTPTVTWTKEGGPVPRAVIDSTESYTMLLVPESIRNDTGKYELTLENSAGKKSADIHVRVLDTPGPPINLKPVKIDKESISLQWEMPLVDGGAKITNYIIEKRESTRKAFATVITNCPTTSVRIGDLGEGCEYYFRVSAENEYGIGEAVETTDPIRASQSPCAPESIIPTDITKNSVTGSDIKIEIPVFGRPRPTISWQKNDTALKLTQRINVETTAATAVLNISECTRDDSGVYTILGKNIVGSVKDNIIVKI
uniref:Titin n=1 Tax=Oryzias latipes TaxID=8090 RepID=A0A3B3I3U9_ORYLA